MDRMTDEELAQLEQVLKAYRFKPSENMTTDVEWRLLQALKAEREYWSKHICAEAENEQRIRELEDALKHIARHFGSAEQCRELAGEALYGDTLR